jgi:predicted alpha/beta hydrolase
MDRYQQMNCAQTTLSIKATDGFVLAATSFAATALHTPAKAIVIINCATGAPARYYHRYARFLTGHGFDAITWDYRGVAASRPPDMRGFAATMVTWGELDFTAVLAYARELAAATVPIYVIGHSIGGFLPGLTSHNVHIKKLITVGAQLAYWPDYWWRKRVQMLVTWHGFAPAVTALAGYFPARRLGLGEDLPSGVIRDWIATKHKAAILRPGFAQRPLPTYYARFATLTAPTLAYSFTDDEFATEVAVKRIFALMRATKPTHRRLAPADIGMPSIGHFGFFLDKFKATLWTETVEWFNTT